MPSAGPFSFQWGNAAASIRGRGVKKTATADEVDYTGAATDYCIGVTDSADIAGKVGTATSPIDIHTMRGLKILVEMDGSGTSIAPADQVSAGANGIFLKAATSSRQCGISCGTSAAASTLRWILFTGSTDEVAS